MLSQRNQIDLFLCVCVEFISLHVLCANRFYFKVDRQCLFSLSTGLESVVSLTPQLTHPSMTLNL